MEGIILNPTVLIAAGAIVTGVVGVAGFVIGNNRNESKARGRIYGRLDETKKEANDTFVRKEVCDVKYDTLLRGQNVMQCDIKKLLRKNGIEE